MVRGFPGGGDAPYLTVQVNGVPLYPISTLAFLENTTMFRIDETVRTGRSAARRPEPGVLERPARPDDELHPAQG